MRALYCASGDGRGKTDGAEVAGVNGVPQRDVGKGAACRNGLT
jgi:hypothetical protein